MSLEEDYLESLLRELDGEIELEREREVLESSNIHSPVQRFIKRARPSVAARTLLEDSTLARNAAEQPAPGPTEAETADLRLLQISSGLMRSTGNLMICRHSGPNGVRRSTSPLAATDITIFIQPCALEQCQRQAALVTSAMKGKPSCDAWTAFSVQSVFCVATVTLQPTLTRTSTEGKASLRGIGSPYPLCSASLKMDSPMHKVCLLL